MKKIYIFLMTAVAALVLTSCSDNSYEYYPADNSGSWSGHNEPPKRTLPGKVIFDHTINVFTNYTLFMNEVLIFDMYYRADEYERKEIKNTYYRSNTITSIGDTWLIKKKVYNTVYTWQFKMLNYKALNEPGAKWIVSCNSGYMYIPAGKCTVSYVDANTLELNIDPEVQKQAVAVNVFGENVSFFGDALMNVAYEYNVLSESLPFILEFDGSGVLTASREPEFTIEYQTDTPLVCNELFSQYYDIELNFNGEITMRAENSKKNITDDITAFLYGVSEVDITYSDITEKWSYRKVVDGYRY